MCAKGRAHADNGGDPQGRKEAADQAGRAVSPIRTPETTSGTIRSGNRQEEQKVLNIPRGLLSLRPLQHSPGVHQGTLRIKESLKYPRMSPRRQKSYAPPPVFSQFVGVSGMAGLSFYGP